MDHGRDGVPLAHYLEQHPNFKVRFSCNACQLSFDVPTAQVVSKLEARGLGDARTGVRAVARLSGRRCRRCGAVDWDTRPAYYPYKPH